MASGMVQQGTPPPEVLEAAASIVDQVIAEAESQVASKMGTTNVQKEEEELSGFAGILKRGTRWQNRARGFFNRILTNLKICKKSSSWDVRSS